MLTGAPLLLLCRPNISGGQSNNNNNRYIMILSGWKKSGWQKWVEINVIFIVHKHFSSKCAKIINIKRVKFLKFSGISCAFYFYLYYGFTPVGPLKRMTLYV